MADKDLLFDIPLPERVREGINSRKISSGRKRELLKRAEEKYQNMLISPGEAIGIIAAQSLGEPGTQLSLPASERVLVKINGEIRAVKIGKFIDEIMSTKRHAKKWDAEVCTIEEDYEVLSLNKDERLEWKKLKECIRHKNKDPLLEFTLRSGRKIIATRAHSFVIRKKNQIIPIAGSKLKVGDRLPVIKQLPTGIKDFVSLNDYFDPKEYWYGSELKKAMNLGQDYIKGYDEEYIVPVKVDQLRNQIYGRSINQMTEGFVYPMQIHSAETGLPEVIELDEDFGWLMGAYLSEGSTAPYFINIANSEQPFIAKARRVANKFGFTTNEYDNTFGGHDFRINSKMLSTLIQSVCSKRAANKRVPDFAYSAPLSFVSALLRAYFDGDGNITVERRAIRAHSASKKLLDGIALLLARFGIFARKSKEKYYTLSIPYRYAPLFLDKVGLDIKHKKEQLKKLAKIALTEQKRYTYDIIEMHVGFGDILYRLAKNLGIPIREVNNFTKRQKIGRKTLERYIRKFRSLATKQDIDINEDLLILEKMANSDVIWDEIIDIQKVKDDGKYLYDFSVPGLETFATFDGVITHNTMRTFHFVGVAELNVTTGLPRIIEILDAKKVIKNKAMLIYLKSPHSKNRVSANKIATRIKQLTLEHIAEEFILNIAALRVDVKLNEKSIKEHGLTIAKVFNILKEQLKDSKVKLIRSEIYIEPANKDLKKIYKLKEKIKNIRIAGIQNIESTLAVKKDSEYAIQTYGSNLKGIFALPEVDASRTISNDLYEIASTLGIEAARQAIVNEILKVLEEEGMPVDERYIMLIADAMCKDGTLQGITRHGITGGKRSVLARASFEIPLKHLIKASVMGEVDPLNSVVENIMINQAIPVGTGLPELVVKVKKKKK